MHRSRRADAEQGTPRLRSAALKTRKRKRPRSREISGGAKRSKQESRRQDQSPMLYYLRHLLAFIFAIQEINSRGDILPNITLGYILYDSCEAERRALQNTLCVITGREIITPNYNCYQKGQLVGIVGHQQSSLSVSMASVIGIYKYPQLNYYLKRIHVLTPGKEEIYFNRDGHFLPKFDVLNFIIFENKSKQTNTVGYYRETNGIQLQINNSAIRWNPKFFQTPASTCSKSCLIGYQRIPMKGQHKCCFSCYTCPEGQISNATDMEKCMTCPKDKFSNQERTACIPRATEFLSHGDALGISLIVISLLFCFLTAVISGIFVKYKDTAIVKANNRNFSFILLLSLMLSFLCPLLFIGRPSKLSCLLRQVAFGNIFTVAVSSVLAKTVTVVLAFRATKPDRTVRKWLRKNLATSLLLVSSFGQFVICVLWLIISPPFPEHNTQVAFDKIILQCNEGSSIAFYIVFVYIGFLAMLSFIVAFLARRLPDTFNEAQYITFSMLVFCSVWISFIPAYLSTKGKYMVAVEVFAISCSSAGLLGCIFIPKCYIILLKPELNTLTILKDKEQRVALFVQSTQRDHSQ
ncbi:vomeronasal type-2 receptor 26-like [Bufo bufo]|uniref:vomeronasal type-2 receptor 26-like n=1 Tax=Bufo bufo TaxID=8384 RepID=UPI001ABEAAD7|nr:vomeronasal type-2 receptor 26-like [Bufo bufo]